MCHTSIEFSQRIQIVIVFVHKTCNIIQKTNGGMSTTLHFKYYDISF